MTKTTKKYKGATISITPTTVAYRDQAEIFNHIHFWLSVSGAATGNIYNMPVACLPKALLHARRRILKARTHPRLGWA